MERKLIANHLVPDDEVWVSPATWERPFSLKAKESTATDTQQLKAKIAAIADSVEDYTTTGADAGTVACIVRDLRQLSAV